MSHDADIFASLHAHGVKYDATSLQRYGSQGLVSSVYSIDTSEGPLIVHHTEKSPSRAHFRAWEKLQPVSRFLRSIPGFPASDVLFSEDFGANYVTAETKLRGQNAGTIAFADDDIVLTWNEHRALYEPQLENLIATYHARPVEGYGNVTETGETLRGAYGSWHDFLNMELPFFADGIQDASVRLGISSDTLHTDIRDFCTRVIPYLSYDATASLISCDSINPSNVLVDGSGITGIIDWEWALAGDPAWEFAYAQSYALTSYFAQFPHLHDPRAQRWFRLRADIYEFLIYMMWCYAVSGDTDTRFFRVTRERLVKKLQEATRIYERLQALDNM